MARAHRLLTPLSLVALAVLAACGALPRGPDYARVPAGSVLTLPAAGADGVTWIQNGAFLAGGAVARRGGPFCRWAAAEGGPRWRVVGFDVRRASAGRQVAPVLGRDSEPVDLLHYRSLLFVADDAGRRGQLRCSRTGVPPRGRYLRPAEIDRLLAPLGGLQRARTDGHPAGSNDSP